MNLKKYLYIYYIMTNNLDIKNISKETIAQNVKDNTKEKEIKKSPNNFLTIGRFQIYTTEIEKTI